MILFVLFGLIYFILLLLGVSFLTLHEQYLIALSQNRLGPNKNSFIGFFQAVFDGLKLIFMENLFLLKINFIIFWFCLGLFSFGFVSWLFFYLNLFWFFWRIINIYIFISFFVLLNLLLGVFRKSKYSFIGSLRFCNQSFSFEIGLFCLVFILLIIIKSLNFVKFFSIWLLFGLFLILFIILIELNRLPFDFSEGERELVGGWITEIRRIYFILIFIGEYNIIIFFCFLIGLLIYYNIFFYLFVLRFLVFIRCVYPRFRYDFLISIFWFEILIIILRVLVFLGILL